MVGGNRRLKKTQKKGVHKRHKINKRIFLCGGGEKTEGVLALAERGSPVPGRLADVCIVCVVVWLVQSVQMVTPFGAWMSGWAPFLALMAMGPSGVG